MTMFAVRVLFHMLSVSVIFHTLAALAGPNNLPQQFSPHALGCPLAYDPMTHVHSVTAQHYPVCCDLHPLSLLGYSDSYSYKNVLQMGLNIPCLVTSLTGTGKGLT